MNFRCLGSNSKILLRSRFKPCILASTPCLIHLFTQRPIYRKSDFRNSNPYWSKELSNAEVVVCPGSAQTSSVGISLVSLIEIRDNAKYPGVPRFSSRIRSGNTVQQVWRVKLTPYSGRNVLMQLVHNPPAELMGVILACFSWTALTGCAFYLTNLSNSRRQK
jgi:hypothetical protein